MDCVPKRNAKRVPFQTITRSHAFKEVPPIAISTVKVVLKKINESQMNHSENSSLSPKKKSSTSSPERIPDGSIQDNSKKMGSLDLSSTASLPSTSEVDVIDLSNSTSHSSLRIQPNLFGKRKNMKAHPTTKTKLRKTVSGTVNKKIKKKSRGTITKTPKSNVSRTSSGNVCTGSKNCHNCLKKEENINILESKIKKLEEKDKLTQRRLSIYEGLGLSHLQKEGENKSLLKNKMNLQAKLGKYEEELHNHRENEDNEIKILIHKKNMLKRNLSKKMEECEKEDAEEEEELKKIRERAEKLKTSEANLKIEWEELIKEVAVLDEKVAEEKKKFQSRPKELAVEEPIRGPCGICKKLVEEMKKAKNEWKEAEIKNPAIKQELQKLTVNVLDGACDIAHLSYEIEYMKKRILSETFYNTKNEDVIFECRNWDTHDRQKYSEKICEMMDKQYSSKRFDTEPISAIALPKTFVEMDQIERIKEDDMDICCVKFDRQHCKRFFCGRYKTDEDNMTKEERIKYETEGFQPLPGRLETEEGKKVYIERLVNQILRGYPFERLKFLKNSF